MKHVRITAQPVPRRIPPRWMVSPHYWREIELCEQQASYEITRSVDEATGWQSDVVAPLERDLG